MHHWAKGLILCNAAYCVQLPCCATAISNKFFVSLWFLFSDYASGFGGKYGVQADRVDKSAVGFDYQGKTEKHESQKGWLC